MKSPLVIMVLRTYMQASGTGLFMVLCAFKRCNISH